MKGFYFLLFTVSFLIMIQNMRKLRLRYVKPLAQLIQSGILQPAPAPTTATIATTATTATTGTTATTATTSTSSSVSHPTITTKATTTSKTTTCITKASSSTNKKIKAGAPALSGLGSGSVLIFLTSILIQLLHLS